MSEIMVGACSELADGDYRIVAVGELEVGIFRLGERFVAYENRCPHHGGPVCQGKLFNRVEEIIMPDQTSRGLRYTKDRHVVCPWHGYEFSLDTGRHPGDPRVRLRPIPVRVADDAIYIEAPGEAGVSQRLTFLPYDQVAEDISPQRRRARGAGE